MHERPPGSILRRAGPLMLARLGVAAFTFAIPLVLARVLLPASYGTFKQAWLLSNTLFLVLPLGLNQSLVYFVPRHPEKKRLWESHALLLTTLLGVLAAGLLLALGPLVASAFHNPDYRGGDAAGGGVHGVQARGVVLRFRTDGGRPDQGQRRRPHRFRGLLHRVHARRRGGDADRGGAFVGVVIATFAKAAGVLDHAGSARAARLAPGAAAAARVCASVRRRVRAGDPATAVPQLPGERERHRRRVRGVQRGLLPAPHHRHALHARLGDPAAGDRPSTTPAATPRARWGSFAKPSRGSRSSSSPPWPSSGSPRRR